MGTTIQGLRADVERTTGIVHSAIELIKGLAARYADAAAASGDPAAFDELHAQITADTDALAAAVVANPLPTEPIPAPAPAPAPEPAPAPATDAPLTS